MVGMGSTAPASLGHDIASTSTGSYVLRPLVSEIPLSESRDNGINITCVELWESNLYIGTSAGEVLHFVSLPPDANDASQDPTFIFASRLQPNSNPSSDSQSKRGVQQILVLSSVGKACLLCNGTLSFYSLPELSPALRNVVVSNCSWVGGTDLNASEEVAAEGVVLMICVQKCVRLVQISDGPHLIRNIEYANCLISARRNQFACVADSQSYALLDVENRQKINLFPISSLDDNASGGQVEDISFPERSSSLRRASRDASADGRGHGRQSSLGALVGGLGRRQESPQSRGQERVGVDSLDPPVSADVQTTATSHSRSISASDSLSRRPSNGGKALPATPEPPLTPKGPVSTAGRVAASLSPHICSPTTDEFLLTTGTAPSEPGVGIFVNLDGDIVRGTLEFSQYPDAIVVDGKGVDTESSVGASGQEPEGYVLATVRRLVDHGEISTIEIQRWDIDDQQKEWLPIPQSTIHDNQKSAIADIVGIRDVHTKAEVQFPEVGSKLRARRIPMSQENADIEEWELKRNEQEHDFARRLGARSSHIVVWSGNAVWWAVRNPLVLKMDATIERVLQKALERKTYIDRAQLITLINSIRDQDGSTETDFLSLEYLRQKVSLILFHDLVARPWDLGGIPSADKRITEGLLMEGAVDPRLIVSIFPSLRSNVYSGSKGIWVHAGLVETVESHPWTTNINQPDGPVKNKNALNQPEIAGMIKRYLQAWRQRKGFGSVADEVEVFKTVDAALLNVLLHLDRPHAGRTPSIRAELWAVVDSGVDCFDRAVTLLEAYHRLYVLSRLYQQRKMARKVLETWVRIIEGAQDDGGELVDGENKVREYLVRSRDPNLVDEYGVWLARRHPSLGVQVFTDDLRRVKTEPGNVVQLLRQQAPDAVKVYLEHLVFGKKSYQYANDLISYYLDSVLSVLSSSSSARSILSQSYKSYRALHPPKPTYRQFVIENAVPEPWWHDRLRLLELLGGSHGSEFTYDVPTILSRIEPFEQALVPESIILDGRQGRHQQAIRLLVHGLGDFHTAINYCLLGGASIFHPMTGTLAEVDGQSRAEQSLLFKFLLTEFLRIEDFTDRLERTSELLERFGAWYDVRHVLELIPDNWSVELVSGFLIGAFRRLLSDRSEAMIVKSLSGAENLQVASEFVEKCIAVGPRLEQAE